MTPANRAARRYRAWAALSLILSFGCFAAAWTLEPSEPSDFSENPELSEALAQAAANRFNRLGIQSKALADVSTALQSNGISSRRAISFKFNVVQETTPSRRSRFEGRADGMLFRAPVCFPYVLKVHGDFDRGSSGKISRVELQNIEVQFEPGSQCV